MPTAKKPTELALFLSQKTDGAKELVFQALDALKKDGYALVPLPTKEEILKEIKALEGKKK